MIVLYVVLNILMQISALIGDDKLELKEYKDILNVGFGDIEVGTIPQDVDRVLVGDIEIIVAEYDGAGPSPLVPAMEDMAAI